jgi:hypothetical protein
MDDITGKINDHNDKLELIYHQRRVWLYASVIVVVAVIGIISSWFYLSSFNNNLIWWGIISISLIVSVTWWYWTMSAMGELVRAIHTEYQILDDITLNLKHVKVMIECKKVNNDVHCQTCPSHNDCFVNKK